MGGLLLHTTRSTTTKSCGKKFGKFKTSCTYNHTLYDEATGAVVTLPTTTGGLRPYGVDAVFLSTSDTYDASLVVGESLVHNIYAVDSMFVWLPAGMCSCVLAYLQS